MRCLETKLLAVEASTKKDPLNGPFLFTRKCYNPNMVDVEKVVRENIDKSVHLSLGTVSNGKPWVCELHFAYDENLNLYFRSLASTRHSQEITQNPNVAGNVVKQHTLDEGVVGVYFEGTTEVLERVDKNHPAYVCIQARLGIDEDTLEEAGTPGGHKFYKITVDNWYVFGGVGNAPAQKHKLQWADTEG